MLKNTFNSLNDLIIYKAYNEQANILVKNDKHALKNLAVIYCSSNGIYFPNRYDIFKKYMYDMYKFEWEKDEWQIKNAKKHIYIRDVFKQWYVKGINYNINSHEKLIEYLKKETEDYDVITLGSSAGGYIATLIGCELNAKYVLNYSGQFDLSNQKNYNLHLMDYLAKEGKYSNLVNLIKEKETDIFYFVSNDSKVDENDSKIAKMLENIHIFEFNSDVHGAPIVKEALKKIQQMNKEELILLHNRVKKRIINKYLFELRILGVVSFGSIYWKKVISKIFNKKTVVSQ